MEKLARASMEGCPQGGHAEALSLSDNEKQYTAKTAGCFNFGVPLKAGETITSKEVLQALFYNNAKDQINVGFENYKSNTPVQMKIQSVAYIPINEHGDGKYVEIHFAEVGKGTMKHYLRLPYCYMPLAGINGMDFRLWCLRNGNIQKKLQLNNMHQTEEILKQLNRYKKLGCVVTLFFQFFETDWYVSDIKMDTCMCPWCLS